ncbi:mitochondrial 54S ribosomal protein YmL41 [Batrachochytrium dendrobatidis]|nr:mitochondrial 54S ribosomal protein YmL41 [Batrachochytrium dendrobatidis]
MVRSNLPPHQAVFRCPQQLNKLDMKSYLSQLYNITITDIRTMNYTGSTVKKNAGPKRPGRGKMTSPSYKKVIITMDDDFVFPMPPIIGDGTGDETSATTGAVRMPPRVSFGKGSANKVRAKINKQALERGVELDASQTPKDSSTDVQK